MKVFDILQIEQERLSHILSLYEGGEYDEEIRMFIDTRKEEKWLNKMIQDGWICKKINTVGIYHFEKTGIFNQVIPP